MKKILKWSLVILFVVLLIDLGIIGIKIFSHDYDVIPESYIGYVCFLMLAVCGILMLFFYKVSVLWKSTNNERQVLPLLRK